MLLVEVHLFVSSILLLDQLIFMLNQMHRRIHLAPYFLDRRTFLKPCLHNLLLIQEQVLRPLTLNILLSFLQDHFFSAWFDLIIFKALLSKLDRRRLKFMHWFPRFKWRVTLPLLYIMKIFRLVLFFEEQVHQLHGFNLRNMKNYPFFYWTKNDI